MMKTTTPLEDMANAGLQQILKKENERRHAEEYTALMELNKWRRLEAELRELLPFVLRDYMQPIKPFPFMAPEYVTILAPGLSDIRIRVITVMGRWQIAEGRPIEVRPGDGAWGGSCILYAMSELVEALGMAKYQYQRLENKRALANNELVYEDLDEEIPEQTGC